MELTIEQALQQVVAAHKEGKLQEAERLYRAILQSQPLHPDANHNLGLIAVSVNKADVALPLFKTALEANQKIEQFWLSYIEALIAEKQFKDAKRALKKCGKKGVAKDKINTLTQKLVSAQAGDVTILTPSQTELKSLINYYQNRQYGDAEKLAVLLTKQFPDNSFCWKILGSIFKALGKMPDALTAAKKAIELDVHDNQAYLSLGLILEELGRFEEAKVCYKKALLIKPDDSAAHYGLGNVLRSLVKLEESTASYRKAIVLKPDYVEAYSNLGVALSELGRLEEAEAVYKKAIIVNPGYVEAHSNLGNTLRELGKLEEAEASYRKAIVLSPNFADAHNNLAVTLKELGKLEEAEASYNQSLFHKPGVAQTHYNLGNTLRQLGKLEMARASYKQSTTLSPDYAIAHLFLGITLNDLGRLKESEVSYRQAIKCKPDYAEAHCYLAGTLKEQGKAEAAQVSYRRAITLRPDFPEAHYNLGLLLLEDRQYDIAMEQFEIVDTPLGKIYAIKCSFMQDKETIFYEKFDLLVNQGERNAVLGSLALCSEIKYGVKKANPFCSEPLKYVVKTDLYKHYDFESLFIKTAKNILANNLVAYKAQGLLTNGNQTAGNIFNLGKVIGTKIESIILTEIEKYRDHFKESEEGFIKNWPEDYKLYGWLVHMQSGGKLAPHIHETGWISGSVYINVPPKSKVNGGNLVLSLSDQEHAIEMKESQQSIIDVVTGSLCLFPSSLHHYTVPFEEKENRIVLAFDVVPSKYFTTVDYPVPLA